MLSGFEIAKKTTAFADEILDLAEERGLEESVVYALPAEIQMQLANERDHTERIYKRQYKRDSKNAR